jgi:hypothetical protein
MWQHEVRSAVDDRYIKGLGPADNAFVSVPTLYAILKKIDPVSCGCGGGWRRKKKPLREVQRVVASGFGVDPDERLEPSRTVLVKDFVMRLRHFLPARSGPPLSGTVRGFDTDSEDDDDEDWIRH